MNSHRLHPITEQEPPQQHAGFAELPLVSPPNDGAGKMHKTVFPGFPPVRGWKVSSEPDPAPWQSFAVSFGMD